MSAQASQSAWTKLSAVFAMPCPVHLPASAPAAVAAPWLHPAPEPTGTASTVVAPPGAERVTASRLRTEVAFAPDPCECGQPEAAADVAAWEQPCAAAADADLQAAAICGVHLAAIAAVHDDLDE